MGIAAGVFLILAAIMNYFAAIAYNLKAKLNTGAANVGDKVVNAIDANVDENVEADFSSYRNTGMINKIFSTYLYISIPVLIVGAVFLFQETNAMVIAIAAIVSIIAELVGGIMSKFGPTNAAGFIGGVLALAVVIPLLTA